MDFSPILFDTVVIVTRNDDHAKRDRRSLAPFRPRRVEQFASAAAAMEFLSANRVDMILLDYGIEDMDALRFLRLLRRDRKLAQVPVVMVTTQSQRDKVPRRHCRRLRRLHPAPLLRGDLQQACPARLPGRTRP